MMNIEIILIIMMINIIYGVYSHQLLMIQETAISILQEGNMQDGRLKVDMLLEKMQITLQILQLNLENTIKVSLRKIHLPIELYLESNLIVQKNHKDIGLVEAVL